MVFCFAFCLFARVFCPPSYPPPPLIGKLSLFPRAYQKVFSSFLKKLSRYGRKAYTFRLNRTTGTLEWHVARSCGEWVRLRSHDVVKTPRSAIKTLCNSRLLRSHMRLKRNRPYNHWLKSQGHYLLCFSTSKRSEPIRFTCDTRLKPVTA